MFCLSIEEQLTFYKLAVLKALGKDSCRENPDTRRESACAISHALRAEHSYSSLRLQSQLHKPADGFGPAGQVVLLAAPVVDISQATGGNADCHGFTLDRRTAAGFFNVIYS